jgi:AcrR family transcriptional regulator
MPKRSSTPAVPLIWTQPAPAARHRSLGRAEIVSAAIALVDADGPDALTMKAVAGRLGPYTPMALYRYVQSKDGLVDLMLDTAIGTVPVPEQPGPDWRADLRGVATATREMINTHPWYAWLVHTRPPVGPNTMHRAEFMLAVLVGRGATVPAAMTFTALIDRHIFGSGLQEAQEARFNESHGLDRPEDVIAAIASVRDLAVADGRLPLLASWLAEPTAGGVDEQFQLGLDFLLDGIATRLPRRRRASTTPRSKTPRPTPSGPADGG